ncbi:MAG TPA: hypothetical protein VFS60_03350 [Thermoanaerobaculia bacterium]|nr:hypothetical protein [Thermoanaerobaculia bacterium]
MSWQVLRVSKLFVATLVGAVLLPADAAVAPSGKPCRPSTSAPQPSAPGLGCAAPPSTFDVSSFFGGSATPATKLQAGPTFDAWAWESFAAFNWPAKADPSQPTGFVRGVPDVTASFLNASGTQVLLWETFKEKREVFNNNVQAGQWQPLTYPPSQTVGAPGGVPACSPQDQAKLALLPGGAHRRILQASKLAPALAVGPNALDETAEVASPAQEAQAALCAGYSGKALGDCQNTFPVPPGGNAGTAYPPTITNPRPGVGPRVFDPNGNLVYYEVRVNYDYFSYVLNNGLNFVNPPTPPPPPGGAPALKPPYSLPWRTSAQAPPVSAQIRNSTAKYEAAATAGLYGSSPTTPPPVGSVQVKSAWKLLSSADPTYHTTDAVYFSTTPAGTPCYSVATFGLIGLHIIQRAHMGDSGDANADPVGGTFVFATWEHNSIADGGGYSYVSFLSAGGVEQQNPTPYPALANAIPVHRQQKYPLATTSGVTQAVYQQLPANSVWRNYRLVGTQFYSNVTAATTAQYNQPYFLANLVVETNNGLQNFQGLPPKVTPNPNYKGFTPTTGAYNPNVPNVSFNGTPYVMGGCMGCHGVAQILGSNFSFVLLDGQRGAGIDTPATVAIPPSPPPTGGSR